MDRIRLKQIIREEINKELNNMEDDNVLISPEMNLGIISISENYKNMKKLNEGCWGYGSFDSDGALDRISVYTDSMISILEDQINKMDLSTAQEGWFAIGLVDNVMNMLISTNKLLNVSDEIKGILNKYYKPSLDRCIKDTKWQEGYDEPEKIRKSLKLTQKRLESYLEMCDDYSRKLTSKDIPKQIEESINNNPSIIDKITLNSKDIKGVYYVKKNIMGFNIKGYPEIKLIDKAIKTIKHKFNIDVNKNNLNIINSSNINSYSKIIPYDKLINNQTKKYFNSNTFKKEKAMHNASAEEKRKDNNMKKYLSDRNNNIGKKLTMQNGKEMPIVQWRALHSTSENKKH